jgi:hypothetical protein
MITANIGRSFLNHYNKKNDLNLSAKTFFEEVFFKLFFDHPKYLYWVVNSPFVQMKGGQKVHTLTSAERLEKLEDLHQKIENKIIDASTTIGFSASEAKEFATTSGQVTDLVIETTPEMVYCSWIGGGLGIGVGGGQVILFDNPVVFDVLLQGWQMYRNYLNDPAYDGLSGNKINSWNGQWLSHVLGTSYKTDDPLQSFTGLEPADKDGNIEIPPQSWLKVILAIARKIPLPSMTSYIYKHGQTNSTYGFIPFNLSTIQRPSELYVQLFGEYAYKKDARIIENLYGSAASFQRICQMGAVGVAALEPKGLKDIMKGGKAFKFDNKPETQITFNTYLTWTLAMLNNDEFWDQAGAAAELFVTYEMGAGKLKADRGNQIEKIKTAMGKRACLDAFVPVLEKVDKAQLENWLALSERIHKLPSDMFGYFMTLVKLRHTEKSRTTSNETITQ